MTCDDVLAAFDLLLDAQNGQGALDPELEAALRAHLRGCAGCRGALAREGELGQDLVRLLGRTVLRDLPRTTLRDLEED
ncbi:MAG: zf-HC2 domain-containing protein [Planctomycetota bacterium]